MGDMLELTGLRGDGRRPHEGRRIRCAIGVLSRGTSGGFSDEDDGDDAVKLSIAGLTAMAGGSVMLERPDGSAYLEMGNTKVLCTVFGPRSPSKASWAKSDRAILKVDVATAPFAGVERRPLRTGDRKSQDASRHVLGALQSSVLAEKYPGSQIDVFVIVLQSDGGELSAAVNVATMALADAGVNMKDLVVSSSAALLDRTPVLDPSYSELVGGTPEVPVAILPRSDAITLLRLADRLPIAQFDELVALATDGCRQVHDVIRAALREDAAKRIASTEI